LSRQSIDEKHRELKKRYLSLLCRPGSLSVGAGAWAGRRSAPRVTRRSGQLPARRRSTGDRATGDCALPPRPPAGTGTRGASGCVVRLTGWRHATSGGPSSRCVRTLLDHLESVAQAAGGALGANNLHATTRRSSLAFPRPSNTASESASNGAQGGICSRVGIAGVRGFR